MLRISGVSGLSGGLPLFLSVISRRIGMMDCWNGGIMGIKIANNRSLVFPLLNTSFQYPIIPIFQLGEVLSSLIIKLQKYLLQNPGNSSHSCLDKGEHFLIS
jgi:hypothetical protein